MTEVNYLKDNAGFKLSSVIYIFEQQRLKTRKKNSYNDQTLVKNISKCFWGKSKISSMYIHTRTYTQFSSQFQDEY